VTVGESDYLLPVSASQEIVDAIPNSELVVFKNRPHLVTMESPEEFNSVTLNWMEKNCTS
jgi:pimeloyl-ACP methyl ester carboxylesterase